MVLNQIDVISLQTFEGGFNLPCRDLFGTAIDLRHQKNLLTIAILQRIPHPHLAPAFVVVPTVVHERNTAIDGEAHQANAVFLGMRRLGDMKAAHPDG